MNTKAQTVRGALVGATAALSILATLLAAACAVKQPYDYPAMRLTSAPASDAEIRH